MYTCMKGKYSVTVILCLKGKQTRNTHRIETQFKKG